MLSDNVKNKSMFDVVEDIQEQKLLELQSRPTQCTSYVCNRLIGLVSTMQKHAL